LPVGNDIIDLLDRESDPSGLHPRYLERVFTCEEREALHRSRLDKMRLELWSRLAAKEATFKALAARRPELVFSPRTFATSLMAPTTNGQRHGWVEHGGLRIPVLLHHSVTFLHAIAATASELDHAHLLTKVSPIMNDTDPSSAVRRSAKRCLAQYLGCDERRVQVRGRRPPGFFIGGQSAAHSLSLSHHGAWVAFAFCVDSPESPQSFESPNPTEQTASS